MPAPPPARPAANPKFEPAASTDYYPTIQNPTPASAVISSPRQSATISSSDRPRNPSPQTIPLATAMPDLPCDGDGVCMVCRVASPPEVDLLTCSTCTTPWHSPCLSKPPALADAASWSCPDCSPDSAAVAAPSGPANTLVAAIRAIEADHTLSDQEKARRRQALLTGDAPDGADDDDDEASDDALEIVGKNFSCVFCMKLPERPVTVTIPLSPFYIRRRSVLQSVPVLLLSF